MTGIERLRDIVDDGPYSGGMIHISVQKLREICEQIEREFGVETVKADGIAANNRRVELCAALGVDTDTGWSDADGVEIRVGDTVYDVDTGEKMWVCALPEQGAYQCVKLRLANGMSTALDPYRLTHRAPVLAADGRPLREGELGAS